MSDQVQYVAVGWSRRPNGGNMFRNSRRHLRVSTNTGTGVRTVCGLSIHPSVLYAHLAGLETISRQFSTTPLSLTSIVDDELAQEPACLRCYARAGRPVVSADGRAALAQHVGAPAGPRFTAALFEAEGLAVVDRQAC